MYFLGGLGKPWKSPFQNCPEEGGEQDKGHLQIKSPASLHGVSSRTVRSPGQPRAHSARPEGCPGAQLSASAGSRSRSHGISERCDS